MTPVEKYQQLLADPQFFEDPEQRRVVELLEALYQILRARGKRNQGLLSKLGSFRGKAESPVMGLYLWGGVGRGKTMLMDLFYECLPAGDRLRMHFHRFMHRVHRELNELSGTPDPLKEVADGIAAETRVICFDEFFVSDIGDAMILGELFEHLFDRGITLVATSNVAPDLLYENGLQRRRFLPAIEAIKAHTRVHCLDSETDYRLRVLSGRKSTTCPRCGGGAEPVAELPCAGAGQTGAERGAQHRKPDHQGPHGGGRRRLV